MACSLSERSPLKAGEYSMETLELITANLTICCIKCYIYKSIEFVIMISIVNILGLALYYLLYDLIYYLRLFYLNHKSKK